MKYCDEHKEVSGVNNACKNWPRVSCEGNGHHAGHILPWNQRYCSTAGHQRGTNAWKLTVSPVEPFLAFSLILAAAPLTASW